MRASTERQCKTQSNERVQSLFERVRKNDGTHIVVVIPEGDISEQDSVDSDDSDFSDTGDGRESDSIEDISEDEVDVDPAGKNTFKWRRRAPDQEVLKFVVVKEPKRKKRKAEDTSGLSPYLLFKEYLPTQLFTYFAEQTNAYSIQNTGTSVDTSSLEMEQLFAIWLYSGVVSVPAYRDFWSSATRVPAVADIMPVNRYEKLMQHFHMCDNTKIKGPEEDGYDALFKIRALYDSVRKSCRSNAQTENQSIDEQIIPFKGRHSHKQYLPCKPNPWGFKVITRASSTGIVFDFILYCGKYTENEFSVKTLSVTSNIVITLCSSIPSQVTGVKLFMDNYYMDVDLMLHLKRDRQIETCGTFRSNRIRKCPLEDEKALKGRGRGSHDQQTDVKSNLCMVRWYDNRAVTMGSTFLQASPLGKVKRWDSKQKKSIEITRPNIVAVYNRNMGGVDLGDMLQALYRCQRRSRKWYMRIVQYLVWTALSNCWLTHREHIPDKREGFKYFILSVAEGLAKAGKSSGCAAGR
jgi:hypothetical protein